MPLHETGTPGLRPSKLSTSRWKPVDGWTRHHLQLKDFNEPERWIAAFFRILLDKGSRWRFCISKVDEDLLLLETSPPIAGRELAAAMGL